MFPFIIGYFFAHQKLRSVLDSITHEKVAQVFKVAPKLWMTVPLGVFKVVTRVSVFMTAVSLTFGISPFKLYKEAKATEREMATTLEEVVVSQTDYMPGLPKGCKIKDLPEKLQSMISDQTISNLVLMEIVEATMNLDAKTLTIIEQDLKN